MTRAWSPQRRRRRALSMNSGRLSTLPPRRRSRRVWRIPGAAGTIGFISPISEPFCSTCNRVRLSSDGKLRLCLLRADEIDLREIVRNGGTRQELIGRIRAGIWRKPWGHGIAEGDRNIGRGMSQIGG